MACWHNNMVLLGMVKKQTPQLKMLNSLRSAGVDPYPHKFEVAISITDYVAKYSSLGTGEHLLSVSESLAGYIGHLKERKLKDQMAKDPTEVIRKAVMRMLPRNKLRDNKQTKSSVQTVPQGIKRHPRSARPQRIGSFLPPPGCQW